MKLDRTVVVVLLCLWLHYLVTLSHHEFLLPEHKETNPEVLLQLVETCKDCSFGNNQLSCAEKDWSWNYLKEPNKLLQVCLQFYSGLPSRISPNDTCERNGQLLRFQDATEQEKIIMCVEDTTPRNKLAERKRCASVIKVFFTPRLTTEPQETKSWTSKPLFLFGSVVEPYSKLQGNIRMKPKWLLEQAFKSLNEEDEYVSAAKVKDYVRNGLFYVSRNRLQDLSVIETLVRVSFNHKLVVGYIRDKDSRTLVVELILKTSEAPGGVVVVASQPQIVLDQPKNEDVGDVHSNDCSDLEDELFEEEEKEETFTGFEAAPLSVLEVRNMIQKGVKLDVVEENEQETEADGAEELNVTVESEGGTTTEEEHLRGSNDSLPVFLDDIYREGDIEIAREECIEIHLIKNLFNDYQEGGVMTLGSFAELLANEQELASTLQLCAVPFQVFPMTYEEFNQWVVEKVDKESLKKIAEEAVEMLDHKEPNGEEMDHKEPNIIEPTEELDNMGSNLDDAIESDVNLEDDKLAIPAVLEEQNYVHDEELDFMGAPLLSKLLNTEANVEAVRKSERNPVKIPVCKKEISPPENPSMKNLHPPHTISNPMVSVNQLEVHNTGVGNTSNFVVRQNPVNQMEQFQTMMQMVMSNLQYFSSGIPGMVNGSQFQPGFPGVVNASQFQPGFPGMAPRIPNIAPGSHPNYNPTAVQRSVAPPAAVRLLLSVTGDLEDWHFEVNEAECERFRDLKKIVSTYAEQKGTLKNYIMMLGYFCMNDYSWVNYDVAIDNRVPLTQFFKQHLRKERSAVLREMKRYSAQELISFIRKNTSCRRRKVPIIQ